MQLEDVCCLPLLDSTALAASLPARKLQLRHVEVTGPDLSDFADQLLPGFADLLLLTQV